MPRIQYAVTAFTTGVVTERLSARLDPEVYMSALLEGENFYITPQGGLLFREGRQHQALTEQSRVFQFHRGGDESDLLIQINTDGTIDLYENDVTKGRDFTTPFKTLDGLLIDPAVDTEEEYEDYLEGFYMHNTERMACICHPDYPPYFIFEDYYEEYIGRHVRTTEVPEVEYPDEKSPEAAAVQSEYTVEIPADWTAGDRFVVFYDGDVGYSGGEDGTKFFPVWTEDPNLNAIAVVNALKATFWLRDNESLITAPPGGLSPGGSGVFIIQGKNAGREMAIESRTQKDSPTITQDAITSDAIEPAWSYPNVVSHDGSGSDRYYLCKIPHWSGPGAADPNISFSWHGYEVTEPGVGTDWQTYWEDLGTTPPWWYEWQYFKETFNAAGDPLITPPETWNPWEGGPTGGVVYAPWDRGFPGVSVFFQQRLIVMGTEDGPTSIWGSRIGLYTDFQPGVNDADPFYFDLDTSDSPRIKWSEPSQSALIIGTSSGDFRLGADVALGPTDLQLTRQNSARSYNTRAITLDNTAFYIEQGREKLRGTIYGRDRNTWTSRDYSLIAENLFRGKVYRVVMTRSPDPLAYVLRDDGNLIVMCWVPEGDYYRPAFMEMTTDGSITDICGYYDIETEEDILILNTRYAETDYRLETLGYPEREVINRNVETDLTLQEQGVVHLDSWATAVLNDEATFTVANQLTGTVRCLVDDAFVGDYEVINGTITLNEAYTGTVTYGKAYTGKAKTYEVIAGNQRGAALGTRRRWNKISMRLLDSAIPRLNGQLSPERAPQKAMDIPDLIVEGLREVELRNLGWGDGSLEIIQDAPYPTHVVAIYGEVSVENA